MSRRDPRAISLAALQAFFGEAFLHDFGVRLWDGTYLPATGRRRFDFILNAPGALRSALFPPNEVSAGRAFVAKLIDCEGEIEAAVDSLYRAMDHLNPRALAAMAKLLLGLPRERIPRSPRRPRLFGRKHSPARDRMAIGFHYDQPIDFYRAFLDPEMVYSCAYFDDGVSDLAAAQRAKIDYVLRKVRLGPGERLLDIGCGWGGLVLRAAQEYGAHVLGITLSEVQHAYAQQRIAAAGLGDRARVELRDYRELSGEAPFDKIVSIGMVEHVGLRRLPAYFSGAFAHLRPGGIFLNHGIADQSPGRHGVRDLGFVGRFVFPDGELTPVSVTNAAAELAGFEVRDVENLREHYTATLRAWVANLERNREAAIASGGEHAFRTWRLYMAGSAQGFAVGRLGVFQSLLCKPLPGGGVEIPPTRRDLYVRS